MAELGRGAGDSPIRSPRPSGTDAVSRRRLLGAGAGLSATLVVSIASGCTVTDPRIASSGPTTSPRVTSTPTSSPTPTPAAVLQGRDAELALADLARAVLTGRHRADLDESQRGVLKTAEQVHRQHVTALNSPQPTTRPLPSTPASPAPTPRRPAGFDRLDLDESLDLLVDRELAQATRLREAGLNVSGFEALLWGSMSVAAGTLALGVPATRAVPTTPAVTTRRPTAAVSDVEALQSMVRQLHAIVYGYQLALGRLTATSADGRRALASLKDHRRLRDDLIAALVARSASVPAAAGAYVPTVDPTTAGRAARLIRSMETALQPFCGLWLASATKPADRTLALDTLATTAKTARAWNTPLPIWPGWEN